MMNFPGADTGAGGRVDGGPESGVPTGPARGRGRPPGHPPTRERILAAARAEFVAHGYDGATLRGIGAAAGVDAAAVSYHFGSKRGLFAAVAALTLGPATVLRAALDGDDAHLADRLVAHVTRAWEAPDTGPLLVDLVRAAMADPALMDAFRGYLEREVVVPMVDHWGGSASAVDRVTGALTVVIGVIFGRYVVALPALAGQPLDRYRRAVAVPLRSVTPRPGVR